MIHLAGASIGESRVESATETEDEDAAHELKAAAKAARRMNRAADKGSPAQQKRPSSAGSSLSSVPTGSIREEPVKLLNGVKTRSKKLPKGARSTPSPALRQDHDLTTAVVLSHLEHEAEGDFNWGVPSLTVPLFLMQVTTLAQKLDTRVDVQHPRESAGLNTAEAQERLVSGPAVPVFTNACICVGMGVYR
jgi:hypothetical protein